MSTLSKLIVSDPDILGGEPVFKGTRVSVKTLFDYLRSGSTVQEFLNDFPSVGKDTVDSVIASVSQNLYVQA